MRKKIKNVLLFIAILIISIIIVGSIYYTIEYSKKDFELILFTFTGGVEYTAPDVVNNIIFSCLLPVIILVILIYMTILDEFKDKICFNIKSKNKKIYPLEYTAKHKKTYLLVLFILSMIIFVKCFGVDEFIISKIQTTEIFEQYYIDPKSVNIEFPEEKRNLILIIAESIETTVCSKENGGGWSYSIIPELEQIALNNTNFSNTKKLGGAFQTHGTDYSAGGNVAITAGIPLKTVDFLRDKNKYTGNGSYLAGAYTLRRSFKR